MRDERERAIRRIAQGVLMREGETKFTRDQTTINTRVIYNRAMLELPGRNEL